MKALIFDMDGVILDSEKYWRAHGSRFYKDIVPGWEEEYRVKIIGMPVPSIYKTLCKNFKVTVDYPAFLELYNQSAIDIYDNEASLMEGIEELLNKAKAENIPLAIASSARKDWVHRALKKQGITNYFDIIISSEDIKGRGKPDPRIYLEAAKKLKTDPEDCVVIEDANNGVVSAKSAGMFCIGFHNAISGDQDLSMADWEIDSIDKNINKILELFL